MKLETNATLVIPFSGSPNWSIPVMVEYAGHTEATLLAEPGKYPPHFDNGRNWYGRLYYEEGVGEGIVRVTSDCIRMKGVGWYTDPMQRIIWDMGEVAGI
jgi:hypothetical protein